MAKEKKRGFFSWLGFGKEEKAPESAELPPEEHAQPEEPAVHEAESAEQVAPVQTESPEAVRPADSEATAPAAVDAAEEEHSPATPAAVADSEAAAPVAVDAAEEEHSPAAPASVADSEAAAPVAVDAAAEHSPATPAAVADSEAAAPAAVDAAEEEHSPAAPASVADSEAAAPAAVDAAAEHSPATPAAVADSEAAAPAAVDAAAEHSPATPAAVADSEAAAPAAVDVAEEEHSPAAPASVADSEAAAPAAVEPAAQVADAETQPEQQSSVQDDEPEAAEAQEQERPSREGFFARLKRSLVKTRQNFGSGFVSLFRGKKIDDDLFDELEEQLLIADVGVDTTRRIITQLTQQASRKQLRDAEALYGLLKAEMSAILDKVDAPLDVSGKKPFVILMVGVNGVGKTTTIGKLARQYQAQGKSVMLAAGDTFRAAAVEQLQVWGERNKIPVVAQHTGADSASVIFDAIQAAKARGADVLIADTAGRLQNKAHLMEELKKITRVMKKLDVEAPHEVMLTIDASTGQNAISQTKLFHEAVGLTGITLTKLDGTAKGGVIFSVADQFAIPIRYIGVGESIDDLRPFKADDFIEALFARED